MEKAVAETHFEIWVTCPYCGEYQNRVDDLKDHLDSDELRAEECEAELRCENEKCKKLFLVEAIEF